MPSMATLMKVFWGLLGIALMKVGKRRKANARQGPTRTMQVCSQAICTELECNLFALCLTGWVALPYPTLYLIHNAIHTSYYAMCNAGCTEQLNWVLVSG